MNLNATTRTWVPMATAHIDDDKIEVKYGNRRLRVPTRLANYAVWSGGGLFGQQLVVVGKAGEQLGRIRLRTRATRKFERFLNEKLAELARAEHERQATALEAYKAEMQQRQAGEVSEARVVLHADAVEDVYRGGRTEHWKF